MFKKDRERPRNSHRLGKTKEKLWLNAMWDLGLDPGPRKGYQWENGWNPNKAFNCVILMLIS